MQHSLLKPLAIGIYSILGMMAPPAAAQVSVGIMDGAGITTLYSVRAAAGYKYTPGFGRTYRAFATWPLAGRFSLQAEAGYSAQGALTSGIHPVIQPAAPGTLYTDCPGEIRLSYLFTAFMLRYTAALGRGWAVYLQAGPAPQWLMAAEQADKGYGSIYEPGESAAKAVYTYFDAGQNIRKDYHAWNLALDGSTGLMWKMDREYILLSLGASRGIRPVEKDRQAGGAHTTALYYAAIGYGFTLQGQKH